MRLVFFAFLALLKTALSRVRRGPLRPSWSFRFELVAQVMKLNGARIARLDVQAARDDNEALASRLGSKFSHRVERSAASVGGLSGEWFTPRKPSGRTVLYLHGGGFVGGSSNTHHDLLLRLSHLSGARIFAPNYRLAPEHRFPSAHDDALACYRAMLDSPLDPRELVLAGDSCGGNLVLSTLVSARERNWPLPRAQVLISPWVDLSREGGSLVSNLPFDWAEPDDFTQWARRCLQGHAAKDPRASPLFADLKGLPPAWVQVGAAEMLLDQVRDLARSLEQAQVKLTYLELDDMFHNSCLLAPQFAARAAEVEQIAQFIADA